MPGDDPQFSAAVTALGAKLAKRRRPRRRPASSPPSPRSSRPTTARRSNVRRLYNFAGQTTRGYESYARQLRKRYAGCPQLLEDVLDGLFHIAGVRRRGDRATRSTTWSGWPSCSACRRWPSAGSRRPTSARRRTIPTSSSASRRTPPTTAVRKAWRERALGRPPRPGPGARPAGGVRRGGRGQGRGDQRGLSTRSCASGGNSSRRGPLRPERSARSLTAGPAAPTLKG